MGFFLRRSAVSSSHLVSSCSSISFFLFTYVGQIFIADCIPRVIPTVEQSLNATKYQVLLTIFPPTRQITYKSIQIPYCGPQWIEMSLPGSIHVDCIYSMLYENVAWVVSVWGIEFITQATVIPGLVGGHSPAINGCHFDHKTPMLLSISLVMIKWFLHRRRHH